MQFPHLPLARLATVAAAVAAFALAAPALTQQTNRISITTGGTGGVYYPMGGGMANILSKYVPGLSATAEVTGGSVDNLKLINAGKSEVGFIMADAGWDAYQGLDKFKDGKVNARTLMVLYPNKMHVVTIEGTGINKLSDLKGKRVSTGSAGSGTEIMAFRVMEAAGIDGKKDIKQERLGAAESVNAIKDRKIDAFFWVGRRAHRRRHGPGGDTRHQDQADRSRRSGRRDEQEVRAALREERHSRRLLPRAGQAQYRGRRLEHPGHERQDERPDGLHHRQDAVREEGRDRRRPRRGEEHRAQEPGLGSPIPFHPGAKKYLEEQGVKVN